MAPAVDVSSYQYNMNVVAIVDIDGTYQSSGYLLAYVGDSLRGVAESETDPVPVGPYAGLNPFFMIVYSNTNGESLSFELEQNGATIALTMDNSIQFAADGAEGNVIAPVLLSGTVNG